jgi:hypothetical protein
MNRCSRCGGIFVHGEPLREVKFITDDVTSIEHFCIQCDDEFVWGMWPDDWGPPPPPRFVRGAGHG